MSTLNGERIEELLWDNGLDFYHNCNGQGINNIEITTPEGAIVISETFFEDGNWYMDGFYVYIDKVVHESIVEGRYQEIESENELVEKILEMI